MQNTPCRWPWGSRLCTYAHLIVQPACYEKDARQKRKDNAPVMIAFRVAKHSLLTVLIRAKRSSLCKSLTQGWDTPAVKHLYYMRQLVISSRETWYFFGKFTISYQRLYRTVYVILTTATVNKRCILHVWGKSGNWEQLRKPIIVLISPNRSRAKCKNMGLQISLFALFLRTFLMK